MNAIPIHTSSDRRGPHPFFAGAYALGLMVSPDNLALMGRTTGRFGISMVLLLAMAVVIYLAHLNSLKKWFALLGGPADTTPQVGNLAGVWLTYYTLIVRIMAAVFITTGLTVSSGFVFNEVFFYWFPNFAFAYIVLAIAGGLQFLKPETRAKVQCVFIATVLTGLLVLIVAGFAKGWPQYIPPGTLNQPPVMPWLFLPLLLFVGFDMGIPAGQSPAAVKTVQFSIALFGGLMVLWVMVCLQYVAGDRLVSTSIAHMIAAREILGQSGRALMGIVVISGSFAAMNALFTALRRTTVTMARQQTLPQTRVLPHAVVLGVAAIAAVLMASGMAGEEVLETYIRAALLLWIGGYGLLQLRLLTVRPAAGIVIPTRSKLGILTISAVIFSGLATLALTDIHSVLMLKIFAATTGFALILGTIRRMAAPDR